MPELTSIQFDAAAFSFEKLYSPGELIMRSDPLYYMLRIDLPKLAVLFEYDDGSSEGTFAYAHIITIDSHSQHVL